MILHGNKMPTNEPDYDVLVDEKSGLYDLGATAAGKLQWKLFGFMFLMIMFINSDVFISRILSKLDGATDYKEVTSYGTGIQAMLIVLACIIFDVLVRYQIV